MKRILVLAMVVVFCSLLTTGCGFRAFAHGSAGIAMGMPGIGGYKANTSDKAKGNGKGQENQQSEERDCECW